MADLNSGNRRTARPTRPSLNALATALLAAGLASCGGSDKPETTASPASSEERESALALAAAASGDWVKIANEWANFTVGTAQRVRYGSGAQWIEKTVTGTAACTNAFFGRDPIVGVTKQCEKWIPAPEPVPLPAPTPTPSPSLWTKIANEWNNFTVSGAQTVRYGSGTQWIAKTASGTAPCTNAYFGRDPLPGVTKQCEVATAAAPAPTPTPTPTPAPSGSLASVFSAAGRAVIYVNDQPNDVYVDGYVYALASNREIDLRGLISSGNDCFCSAGDNYPRTNTPAQRANWISAAREAGFGNLPDNTNGTQGPRLQKPASGVIEQTARIGSAGSDLIVREALLATPDKPLVVIVAGPITTLADAYLANPAIADRIVVSWIAGYPSRMDRVDDWNADGDKWGAEIVLRKFRVLMVPVFVESGFVYSPHTPEARMLREFPQTRLRQLLLDAGYFMPDYDADGGAAVAVMAPNSYVTTHQRRKVGTDQWGLTLTNDPNGNIYQVTRADPEAGGEEFFRAGNKAFAAAR